MLTEKRKSVLSANSMQAAARGNENYFFFS